MKKTTFAYLTLLATLAVTGSGSALAQRDYESDRRYCASGRSGLDFNSCMRQLQRQGDPRYDRYDGYERRGYERPDRYNDRRPQGWDQQPPPPRYGYEPEWGRRPGNEPREFSKDQQRVWNNCNALPPPQQQRCRAAVLSTVPR